MTSTGYFSHTWQRFPTATEDITLLLTGWVAWWDNDEKTDLVCVKFGGVPLLNKQIMKQSNATERVTTQSWPQVTY